MEEERNVFQKTSGEYLGQIASIDFTPKQERLGVQVAGEQVIVPFFGRPFRVTPASILDPSGKKPSHAVNVVLCKYLLLCPDIIPKESDWVSYKDFKDAAPFVGAFSSNSERLIAKHFARRLAALEEASKSLGGRPPGMELPYALSKRFDALPSVPILLLFNDEDDEFPAQCKLLFERRAAKYLDMECLAMVAMLLSEKLIRAGG